jgi:PAS domain S-box-containing protein
MELNTLLETFIPTIVDGVGGDCVLVLGPIGDHWTTLAEGGLGIPTRIWVDRPPHPPALPRSVSQSIIDVVVESKTMRLQNSIGCWPMLDGDQLVGLLYVEPITRPLELTAAVQRLLAGLCQQMAIAMTQISQCQRLLTYTQTLEQQLCENSHLPESEWTLLPPHTPSIAHSLLLDPATHSSDRDLQYQDRNQDRNQDRKFRQLVENANDLIFTIALDASFTYLSPKFKEMCGYEPAEFIGRSFAYLAHPDDVATMYETLRHQLLNRDTLTGFECRIRHQNGNYIWITSNHSAPIEDETGNVVGFQGIVRDITDRKKVEERLRHTNDQLLITNAELARATRLKDEFLANMSHELRTPLNAILGITEAILEQPYGELSVRYQKSLRMIDTSGQHLLDLINDILDLAKIEAGKLELQLGPTGVNYLCQSSINFVKQLAFQKGLQIDCHIAPDIDSIVADDRRLRQVLINLLSNAVKFTPAGGKIELLVQCDQLAQTVQFQIKDNGIGIAASDLESLFNPFIQIDSSLNRQYSGTGLGLALVKRIVDLHGGSVSVESQENQGSCFTIVLPLLSRDLLPVMPIVPHGYPLQLEQLELAAPAKFVNVIDGTAPVVLLAEDNKMNIEMFSDYLDLHGYQLVVAENGIEAVKLARSHSPQIILMDIQMPQMDGLEAIRLIRSRSEQAHVPILALTALAMPGDAQKCLDAGATDYMAKPVKLRQLVSVIQTLLP